jgi:hypothetical protein
MADTPSSSVLHARQQIAGRLREIRLDAGLTRRQVAAAAGWYESKSSRIEHARTKPSDADIRAADGGPGPPPESRGRHRRCRSPCCPSTAVDHLM